MAFISIIVLPFLLPSPFPVESYRKLAEGSSRFEDLKFSHFDANDRLLGFEKFAGADAEVARLISGDDFTFAFTKDGRVFVLGACESGAEPPLVDTLSWQGDPHGFPYFGKYEYEGP